MELLQRNHPGNEAQTIIVGKAFNKRLVTDKAAQGVGLRNLLGGERYILHVEKLMEQNHLLFWVVFHTISPQERNYTIRYTTQHFSKSNQNNWTIRQSIGGAGI